MLSGTGIRDGVNGGYIPLDELEISAILSSQISKWLSNYEMAHYSQYSNMNENTLLDEEEIKIAKEIKTVLKDVEVIYFSNYLMREIRLD